MSEDERLQELLEHFNDEHEDLFEQFDGAMVTRDLLERMEMEHLAAHVDDPDDEPVDEPSIEADDASTLEDDEAERIRVERADHARAMLAANRGNGIAKYDWEHIMRLFVEGDGQNDDGTTNWPTLIELAARFNVPYESVRKKSATQGWTGKRAEWRNALERERFRARAEKTIAETEALDDEALGVGKLGLALVKARLTDLAQAYRDRVKDGTLVSPISTAELERLAKAGDLFHRIGLRSLGGDTDVTKFEVTGADGGPIEIAGELGRDDPDRIAAVLGVLVQAGLGELFGVDEGGDRRAGRAQAIEARSRSHTEVPEG